MPRAVAAYALIAASCCALAQSDESTRLYIGQAMRQARLCVALMASGKAKEGASLEEALAVAQAPCSSPASGAYKAFLRAGITRPEAARHAEEFTREATRAIKQSVEFCMRPEFAVKTTLQDCLNAETLRR
jgi:hypothetical protein